MKFYTSYFYQIRFLKPYQLAFSTAMWNPAFFREEHVDSEGRLMGLRATPFIPGPICKNDCHGPENCLLTPKNCLFLQHYMTQLRRLDFNKTIKRFEEIAYAVKEDLKFKEEPEILLIVYEAPTNLCSERGPIQQWFAENNMPIQEWHL